MEWAATPGAGTGTRRARRCGDGDIERAMLSGFNTNYRHRGVLFHVQTEDSGRANPRIITHLFHGGNIIASHKRDYSDKLDAADLEAEVKALMERQHKEMLKQLSRGEHDAAIAQRLGEGIFGGGGRESTDSTDSAEVLPPQPDLPTAAEGVPPAEPAPAPAAAAPAGAEPARERIARAFGEGIVTDKPLDEVVLDYLVENARKRKRSGR